ncbi:MAG: hypothetical protein QOJ94_2669 [Sphingomonadales bacterium]|nr:hypothetical protein [Sphingomonadales bacterium]
MRSIPLLAAGLAAFAAPGLAQTSVEIHSGANGQMSGIANEGQASSTVSTGQGTETRAWDERVPPPCAPGRRSRSLRVTSPDGGSSSSVSVSGGTVAVGGAAAPGGIVSEEGCPTAAAATSGTAIHVAEVPRRTYAHRVRRHSARRR